MVTHPAYPYVECDRHPGEREPGYCVCRHVLQEGAAIAHLERATEKNLGVAVCATCFANKDDEDYVLANLTVSCAQGLRERGLLASA